MNSPAPKAAPTAGLKLSAPVVPRLAATTLIVRDGDAGLEVLMVRRSLQASFMPGAYVFPGGAVDAADASHDHPSLCDESAQALARRVGAVTDVGDQALAFAVAALRDHHQRARARRNLLCLLFVEGSSSATPAALAGPLPPRARAHAAPVVQSFLRPHTCTTTSKIWSAPKKNASKGGGGPNSARARARV